MQRTTLMFGFAMAILSTCTLAAAAENPAAGRWDLTVMVGSRKVPSWLEIRPQDGKFVGTVCSAGGGIQKVGEVKVNGDKVEFKSDLVEKPDKFYFTYTATIKNNTINGTRKVAKDLKHPWENLPPGAEHPFIGLKFIPDVDVSGTWKMDAGKDDKATLTLSQAASNISGKMTGKQAGEVSKAATQGAALTTTQAAEVTGAGEVTKAVLHGQILTLAIKKGDKTCKLEANVKGDVMEGTIEHAGGKPENFTAHRERKWGEPIKLFNGKDLEGFKTIDPPGEKADNHWKVVDGVLTNTAGGKNIVSEKNFKDFKLHVEFRVPTGGNSGAYLRGRYEIQVQDDAGNPTGAHNCGALYSRIAPSVNAAKPAGEWQSFDITLVGQYLTVVHNGQTVIDNKEIEGITGGALDSNEFEGGPIYFQGDHGKIEYRNITLAPAK